MKNIPAAIKILLNIIFFVIYSVIWIILWDFIFWWLIFKVLWKTIPWDSDPIHLKIAWVVLVTILVITALLRKYFYLPVSIKSDNIAPNNTKTSEKKPVKEEKVEIEEETKEEKLAEAWEKMKIYIDKEIK